MKALLFSALAVMLLISFGCQSDDSSWNGPNFTPAAGTWSWQNPLPHGNSINDVMFTSADVGWAVGNGGMLLRSTDGGLTWTERNSGTNMDLNTVVFSDAINGWIGGGYVLGADDYFNIEDSGGILLHTSNGGVNWYPRETGSDAMFKRIQFIGNDHGWVVGTDGTILRTTDAGENWQSYSVDYYRSVTAVCFTDLTNGWLVTGNESSYNNGAIYRTWDGGATWGGVLGTADLYDICFQNSDTGWAVGGYGTLMRMTDADSTWYATPSGVSQSLRHIYRKDAQRIWIAGDGGTLLYSIDGGNTWTQRETNSTASLRSVAFSSAGNGIAVGNYGTMLHTVNGGLWWSPDGQSVTLNDLHATSFVDENNGWAVGDKGTMLHTTDGGHSWMLQPDVTMADLYDVEFVDAMHGWAVGGSNSDYLAVTLRTEDGGASWTEQDFGGMTTLISLDMFNLRSGWAIGYYGVPLKTTNGGTTWELVNVQFSSSYNNVCLISDSSIWIANGSYGSTALYHSVNGGQDWERLYFYDLGGSPRITFVNENNGWACGEHGMIMHTTDAGASWTLQPSGTTRALNNITFLDENYGWAVGDHGVSLFTTDGGTTWSRADFRNGNNLEGLAFTRSGHGWAVGEGGTILHFTPTAPIL